MAMPVQIMRKSNHSISTIHILLQMNNIHKSRFAVWLDITFF